MYYCWEGPRLLFRVRGEWTRPERPKPEAKRAESGNGVLVGGAGQPAPPPLAMESEGPVSSSIGVWGRAPAAKTFSCILEAPDGLSWFQVRRECRMPPCPFLKFTPARNKALYKMSCLLYNRWARFIAVCYQTRWRKCRPFARCRSTAASTPSPRSATQPSRHAPATSTVKCCQQVAGDRSASVATTASTCSTSRAETSTNTPSVRRCASVRPPLPVFENTYFTFFSDLKKRVFIFFN